MELPLPELGKAAGRVGVEGRGNKDVGSRPSCALCTAEVLEPARPGPPELGAGVRLQGASHPQHWPLWYL